MIVYFVRHGLAEESGENGYNESNDYLRPLTDKGRKRTLQVAKKLHSFIISPHLVITSPYLRAHQTAEIISKEYDLTLEDIPELVPECSPVAFKKWLKSHALDNQNLIVVGHEPNLSQFISFLVSGKSESIIEVKKSSVIAVELPPIKELGQKPAKILWALPYKILFN